MSSIQPLKAADEPPQLYQWPVFDTTIASNGTSTATSITPIPVVPDKVLVVQTIASAAAAGTSNVVFSIKSSLDGRNWVSDAVHTWTVAMNGTNDVVEIDTVATNITGRFVGLSSIASEQTNVVTIESVQYFWK